MKNNQNFGLKPEIINQIQAVFEEFPGIEKAIVYGSRAMGNYRYNSDIDITLKGKNLGLTELFRTENELDELLLPYKIDLSLLHQIDNPDLIKHIEENGKTLYERDALLQSKSK
jgi:predicted nucleotidyltransferase